MTAINTKTTQWPRVITIGRLSIFFNARLILLSVLVSALAAGAFALNIAHGDYPLNIADVVRILAGNGTRIEHKVVFELRMGRAVTALAVGAALGCAGALTQSVARNPLVSPDVLGLTEGASLAVVMTIGFAGLDATRISKGADTLLSTVGIPLVAIAGALITAALIWFIAGSSRAHTMQLVLIGVGAAMFLNAAIVWIMAETDLERSTQAKVWLTGSLNGRDWGNAWPVVGCVLVVCAGAGWLAFRLSALALGEQTAHVLGVNVKLATMIQLLCAVVLSAVAVSAAGPIAFIAFVTPHIARFAAQTATPPFILSALLGGLLVSAADYLARVVLPWELPVGVVTAVCGAPALLYFIIRTYRKTL